MSTREQHTTGALTEAPDATIEIMACALLWLDVAAFALDRRDAGEAGRSITKARMQLRGAIRRLRGHLRD